jgi:DNA polymerase III delta prime subunit
MNLLSAPWSEKYRPKTIDECILPESIKQQFKILVTNESIPHLLLSGSAGCGKTTLARALCSELGYDVKLINASKDNGIDTLRNEIVDYCSSYSISGNKKVLILDEADNLTEQAQKALRATMEQYSARVLFILTCNYKSKLIEAIHSRCANTDFGFNLSEKEKKSLMLALTKRVANILRLENVEFDAKAVFAYIEKKYPDNRRILNELQSFSYNGAITADILSNSKDISIDELKSLITNKEISKTMEWVANNSNNDFSDFYPTVYKNIKSIIPDKSIPNVILTLADYQKHHHNVIDKNLHIVACLIEIMGCL